MLERKIKRERREWLDSIKSEERRLEARKRKEALLKAYEQEVVVPHEIRQEIEEGKITAEEALAEAIYTHGDEEKEDEFSKMEEPNPIITTSRSPSDPLVKFAKSLKHLFPNAEKINRGKHVIRDLVKMGIEKGHTDLIMVNEHKGTPSSITISHLPHGPTTCFSLHHVSSTDTEPISTSPPAVVFDNFSTPLGKRVKRILSRLFSPLAGGEKPKRIAAFVNREDSILFKHYKTSYKEGKPEVEPIGVSFAMKLYEIRRGTLDMSYAEKEFVFRPYLNTARKRLYLGEEVPEEGSGSVGRGDGNVGEKGDAKRDGRGDRDGRGGRSDKGDGKSGRGDRGDHKGDRGNSNVRGKGDRRHGSVRGNAVATRSN